METRISISSHTNYPQTPQAQVTLCGSGVGCKSQRIGRSLVTCCLLDTIQPLHSWTHFNCGDLRKTCTRSAQQVQSAFLRAALIGLSVSELKGGRRNVLGCLEKVAGGVGVEMLKIHCLCVWNCQVINKRYSILLENKEEDRGDCSAVKVLPEDVGSVPIIHLVSCFHSALLCASHVLPNDVIHYKALTSVGSAFLDLQDHETSKSLFSHMLLSVTHSARATQNQLGTLAFLKVGRIIAIIKMTPSDCFNQLLTVG